MKKARGDGVFAAVCRAAQARPASEKKICRQWLVLLACAWAVVGWSFSSVAFADYYTATVSSCTTIHAPGASMYSHATSVNQCNGGLSVIVGKIIFSDTLYYPVVTITTHHSDGSIFVHSYAMAYTDNCNLSIIGDASCLPESVFVVPSPDTGRPECINEITMN